MINNPLKRGLIMQVFCYLISSIDAYLFKAEEKH